jgi:hypothetical protein
MRINLDYQLFSDARFRKLVKLTGCEQRAIGMVVQAWILAQKYWCHEGRSLIPKEEWELLDGWEMLDKSRLVLKKKRGIYVCGTKEHFDWYFKKLDAAKKGGMQSAKKRWGYIGDEVSKSKHVLTSAVSKRNPPDTTPAPDTTPIKNIRINTTSSGDDRVMPLDLEGIWNSNCGTLPKCNSLNAKRKAAIRARTKDQPSAEFWVSLARYLSESAWHNGDNDRGWRAGFDFFVNATTWLKFSENSLAGMGPRRRSENKNTNDNLRVAEKVLNLRSMSDEKQ